MFGSIFDKVTSLFDSRFVMGLLLPTLAFSASVGALVATDDGWGRTTAWWQDLDATQQVAAGVVAATGLTFLALVLSTQVVAMTRVLEGYWRWAWVDKTAGRAGRAWQQHRLSKVSGDTTEMGYLRSYLAFAPAELGSVLPTQLGNTLRAAESYPGDAERWGIDAAFWWPRLYLLIPDSARDQIDSARASLDQMVLLSWLSAVFGAVAIGFGIGGLRFAVSAWCVAGGLVLSWLSYRAAVTSAAVFGDLVRSCFDLFRTDLLAKLGWPVPDCLDDERALWGVLGQQLYRRGTSTEGQALLNAPRSRPAPPAGAPGSS
jgi:hypothetical protein